MAGKMVIRFGLGCLKKIKVKFNFLLLTFAFPMFLNPNPLTITHRGIWVRAMSIASPDSIPRIVEIAQKLAITDIYIQIVVGGYAYYDSDFLPRSEYLSKTSGVDYEPLDSLLHNSIIQKSGIRVHAWVNALLVWSLSALPESLNHLLYIHPEWFLMDVRGRSMANYTSQDWENFGLEGIFFGPGTKRGGGISDRGLLRNCKKISGCWDSS